MGEMNVSVRAGAAEGDPLGGGWVAADAGGCDAGAGEALEAVDGTTLAAEQPVSRTTAIRVEMDLVNETRFMVDTSWVSRWLDRSGTEREGALLQGGGDPVGPMAACGSRDTESRNALKKATPSGPYNEGSDQRK
jgi:hypothetical protein